MRDLLLTLEAVALPIAAIVCLGAALNAMMVHAPGWEIRGVAGIAGYLAVWAVGVVRIYPRLSEPHATQHEL